MLIAVNRLEHLRQIPDDQLPNELDSLWVRVCQSIVQTENINVNHVVFFCLDVTKLLKERLPMPNDDQEPPIAALLDTIHCRLLSSSLADEDRKKFIEFLRRLYAEDVATADLLIELLDPDVLVDIGAISSVDGFKKRTNVLRTTLYYRQHKFNLLREESQGYAKLCVTLTKDMIPTGRACFPSVLRQKYAHSVVENMLALIGTFDLDPNRVLDIFLDVFASNIERHALYFLDILRLSPWTSLDENGNTFPKQQHNLASLLGFKLEFYQKSSKQMRGKVIRTPRELMLLIALLIRERMITLKHIFNKITGPDDEDVKRELNEFIQSLDEQASKTEENALVR